MFEIKRRERRSEITHLFALMFGALAMVFCAMPVVAEAGETEEGVG